MFLIDDVLLFPVHGILAIFREVQAAAEQEIASEADAIRSRLSELYMMLETGQITEAVFDEREHELLDRLDAIEARAAASESPDQETTAEEAAGEEEVEATTAPAVTGHVLGTAE